MENIKKEDIRYEIGGAELLRFASPLWTRLNTHHKDRSEHFKEVFDVFTFADREKRFIEDGKELKVVLAKNIKTDEYIGYSISSISKENVGEIDSIFVDSNYRGFQIGDVLMNEPLEWMKNKNTKKIIIGVAAGNEDVYPLSMESSDFILR